MTSRNTIARVSIVLLAMLLLGSLVMFAAPTHSAKGPYQSALATLGVGNASAASGGHCDGRICEFVAPGYHCLFEGSKSSCVTGTSGCSTIYTCK